MQTDYLLRKTTGELEIVSGNEPFTVTPSGGSGEYDVFRLENGSRVILEAQTPATQKLPTIAGQQREGQLLSLEETGLTGVVARQWLRDGLEISGATGSTYTTTSSDLRSAIQCLIDCDQGMLLTPSAYIYANMMMASHNVDDDAVLALVPHSEATHIAVGDGDWEAASTWDVGEVPGDGAIVLIPLGRSVSYQVASSPRFDRIRCDGLLNRSPTISNDMLVETLVITQTGEYRIGTPTQRVEPGVTVRHRISNRHYPTDADNPTDLDLASDPLLMGRGILNQGKWSVWGEQITPWERTTARPVASDTTLSLQKAPTGWNVGDDVALGGTYAHSDGGFSTPGTFTDQTETMRLTTSSGTSLGWTDGLAHDHDLQNPSLETDTELDDFQPAVFNKRRNVIFETEDGASLPKHQRGHTMSMHMFAVHDLWHASFLELGRTDKNINVGRKSGNDFEFLDRADGQIKLTTFTASSNIISRYPVHCHFCGFGRGEEKAVTVGCYVESAPAWGMVHHGCEADFIDNVMYRFTGAGMVSETADETGAWIGNLACGVESNVANVGSPKNTEGIFSQRGDFGRIGCGFFFRGRAMRTNGNMAMSCTTGYVFFHRSDPNNNIGTVRDPARTNIDLGDLHYLDWENGRLSREDYPIVHFADNESGGCYRGFAVTKSTPEQHHDVNVNLKRFKSWGHQFAADVEYVGTYVLTDWKIAAIQHDHNANWAQSAYSPTTYGIWISGNAQQISVVNARTWEHNRGIHLFADDLLSDADDWNSSNNPLFMIVNHESNGDNPYPIRYITDGSPTNTAEDVTRIFGSIPNESLEPTLADNFPHVVWDGGTANNAGIASITGFVKTDNVGTQGLPKVWDNMGIKDGTGNLAGDTGLLGSWFGDLASRDGYWTYDDGNSVRNILIYPFLIADRLTARPSRHMLGVECTGDMSGYTSNGVFTRSATAPSRADMTETLASGGSATFNPLTGATGESGATLRLWDWPVYKPDHGEVTYDFATGDITYTPDAGYTGVDEMYAFIYDGRGRFDAIKIDITIT